MHKCMYMYIHARAGDSNAVVVEECACADSRCRREDYFLSFWEVVTPSNDINESRLIVKEKVSIQGQKGRGFENLTRFRSSILVDALVSALESVFSQDAIRK